MTELVKNRSRFIMASVALIFCFIWAMIGESDMKIIAVAVAFFCFLKAGIETEMSARALDSHH